MKKFIIILISTLLVSCLISCSEKEASQQNEYFGEEKPTFVPKLFGYHLASDNDNRHSPLAFSPDGKEVYFSVYVNNIHPQKIFFSKQDNSIWTKPAIVSFSGTYKDGGPLFSSDGNKIFFYSQRPLPGDTINNDDYDIWYVERTNNDWGEPIHLDEPINTDDNENLYTFSKGGGLFFDRWTNDRKAYLLQSKFVDGEFHEPIIIKELSKPETFSDPVLIEGEDYFIYTNNVKKGKYYYTALFISYKNNDGSWTSPKDMGDMINYGEGRFPSLSPDGKFLFFLSYRTGISQYYWMDANIIEYLKTEELDLINKLKTIMVDKNLTALTDEYDILVQKHSVYYRFDEILFNEVASELIANDSINKAMEVYNLNFDLYPQQKFYPQKLIVSLFNNDEIGFSNISNKIKSETSVTRQGLHDEINVAGEVFLNKNKFEEAIKVFELNAEINPESSWPHYKLGKAYYKMEENNLAKKYFNKAIKLDSTNIYAANYLKELKIIKK